MSARRPRARLATVIIRRPSRSKRGSEISTEAKDTGVTRAAYTARGRSADTRPRFAPARVGWPRSRGRSDRAGRAQERDVVVGVAPLFQLAAFDRVLAQLAQVADALRRRDRERLHDRVAEAGRQRRHARVEHPD